jgi:acetoin utilization protein AcuB
MLVKDYMTRHPIMIPPTMPAAEAQRIMSENKVRHLPVVGDGKRPLGLITRQNLRIPPTDLGSLNVWEIARYLSEMKAKDLMVKLEDMVTIGPNATLEEAAETMATHKFGCLPVVEDNVVVGIITETDMLLQLADLLGRQVTGLRIVARVPEEVGGYAKVMNTFWTHGWGLYATGSIPAPRRPGFWDLVLKVRDASKEEVVAALEKLEEAEIVDIREI